MKISRRELRQIITEALNEADPHTSAGGTLRTVKKGESISSICRSHFGRELGIKEIQKVVDEHNRRLKKEQTKDKAAKEIKDIKSIKPGDKIFLPGHLTAVKLGLEKE
jgi:hypothetical protein